MEDQITLEEALRLVYFEKFNGEWFVHTVRGDCHFVKGDCDTVIGNCGRVKGNCNNVEGYCGVVGGNCGVVQGDCTVIYGTVKTTISGREWQFIEKPAEKLKRLIVSNSDLWPEMKDEMIKTLNEI